MYRLFTNKTFLLRPPLNKKFNSPIICLLFFRCKITCWNFSPLTMIVETFAAKAMLVAGVCAGTILLIDFCPRALVFLLHYATPSFQRLYYPPNPSGTVDNHPQ